jgi:riboflavin synthase
MFTGIIQRISKVINVITKPGLTTLIINIDNTLLNNIQIGASVAINGVCLTVAEINKNDISFDVMQESLNKTNLSSLEKGSLVNTERSVKQDDEFGGHIVSGHVDMTAQISKIKKPKNNYIIKFCCSKYWMKYIFPKGFISINGASLTIVKTYKKGGFSVHLIPETLKSTTFDSLNVGDDVNIEIDRQTQAIVNTVEHYLKNKKS